jgi:hypothetical protein
MVAPLQLEGSIHRTEQQAAQVWMRQQRIWVVGSSNEEAHKNYWVRTLRAIQSEADKTVVAVDLLDEDPAKGLKDWAEMVHARMLPGDILDDFARVLDELGGCQRWAGEDYPVARYLLGDCQSATLSPDDWFWKELFSEEVTVPICCPHNSGYY